MKKLLSLILVITLLCSMSLPALAADKAIGATLRLEKTEGTVAVKNASGKAQSVKASMRLYSGYTTATEKKSYAYISLDDSKVVKLDALSEVEVQQSGKKLEVMLSKGSLMFDVSEKLKSDESLNIRTSTMLTGVRGTIGIVTVRGITVDLSKYDKVVLENGDIMYLDKLTGECVFLLKGNGELYQSADGSTQNVTLLGNVGNTRNQNVLSISATDIYLLEGELEVKTISGQTVTLTAGQKATVDQVDGTGEVIIRIDEAKLTDTNGSAQMMIADSPEIQQRLSNGGVYTPEQVKEAVENAPEALKREQAEQEAAYEEPTQRDKSVVPAFEDNTPKSGGGGVAVSTTTLNEATRGTINQAFADGYTIVNVNGINPDFNDVDEPIEIPVGKTLNLNASLVNGPDHAITVNGTLNVNRDETLTSSDATLTNSGDVTVNGTMNVAAGATMTNSNDVTVNGTLNVANGATLDNRGMLDIASTNSIHVAGTLDNNGMLNVGTASAPGLAEITGVMTGPDGEVTVANGSTFKTTGTIADTGHFARIRVLPGGTLSIKEQSGMTVTAGEDALTPANGTYSYTNTGTDVVYVEVGIRPNMATITMDNSNFFGYGAEYESAAAPGATITLNLYATSAMEGNFTFAANSLKADVTYADGTTGTINLGTPVMSSNDIAVPANATAMDLYLTDVEFTFSDDFPATTERIAAALADPAIVKVTADSGYSALDANLTVPANKTLILYDSLLVGERGTATLTNHGTITMGTQMTLFAGAQYIGDADSELKVTGDKIYCNTNSSITLTDNAKLSAKNTLWVAGTVNTASGTTVTCGELMMAGGSYTNNGMTTAATYNTDNGTFTGNPIITTP